MQAQRQIGFSVTISHGPYSVHCPTINPYCWLGKGSKCYMATRLHLYCNHHNPASGFTTYQYLIDTCTEDVYNYRTIPAAVEVTTELYQQL